MRRVTEALWRQDYQIPAALFDNSADRADNAGA
jgi:hypothetical protein